MVQEQGHAQAGQGFQNDRHHGKAEGVANGDAPIAGPKTTFFVGIEEQAVFANVVFQANKLVSRNVVDVDVVDVDVVEVVVVEVICTPPV